MIRTKSLGKVTLVLIPLTMLLTSVSGIAESNKSQELRSYGITVGPSAAENIEWIANGTPICEQVLNQITPKIVSDGNGGAIFAWMDYRNSNVDIYAQRIDATGV